MLRWMSLPSFRFHARLGPVLTLLTALVGLAAPGGIARAQVLGPSPNPPPGAAAPAPASPPAAPATKPAVQQPAQPAGPKPAPAPPKAKRATAPAPAPAKPAAAAPVVAPKPVAAPAPAPAAQPIALPPGRAPVGQGAPPVQPPAAAPAPAWQPGAAPPPTVYPLMQQQYQQSAQPPAVAPAAPAPAAAPSPVPAPAPAPAVAPPTPAPAPVPAPAVAPPPAPATTPIAPAPAQAAPPSAADVPPPIPATPPPAGVYPPPPPPLAAEPQEPQTEKRRCVAGDFCFGPVLTGGLLNVFGLGFQARMDYWGFAFDYQFIGLGYKDVEGDLSLITIEGRVFPFGNAFFLSTGFAWQNVALETTVSGTVEGVEVSVDVRGSVNVPVFKIGLGVGGRDGFVFGADIGIGFRLNPADVKLETNIDEASLQEPIRSEFVKANAQFRQAANEWVESLPFTVQLNILRLSYLF